MRIVVRDHDRNRREVYNFRTVRSTRMNRTPRVKDSEDEKVKDLEERVKALEEEIKALSTKKEDEPSEEPEIDEEDLDEVEEDVEESEDESVEDLGDSCTKDSLPRKSLRSIGTLLKTSTKDSAPSDDAEINAWKNRK